MLSFSPDVGIMSLSFHYGVSNIDLPRLIVLRQSGENIKYIFPDGSRSCADAAQGVCSKLGMEFDPVERGFLCEITRFGSYGSAAAVEEECFHELYGIITGDEGYSFVPDEIASSRLQNSWGSRSFIRIYAFGPAFLFLNLIHGRERAAYIDYQHSFGQAAYGGCDAYFDMEPCPLTVNHGILFSVEFTLMLKALIDGILVGQGNFNRLQTGSFYHRIRQTREFRRRIILVLERAENTAITEIGQLSSVLLDSQHIAPIVDRVKYLLELLDGDLSLMYSERSNILVTMLTVLGLLLAALQVVIAVV